MEGAVLQERKRLKPRTPQCARKSAINYGPDKRIEELRQQTSQDLYVSFYWDDITDRNLDLSSFLGATRLAFGRSDKRSYPREEKLETVVFGLGSKLEWLKEVEALVVEVHAGLFHQKDRASVLLIGKLGLGGGELNVAAVTEEQFAEMLRTAAKAIAEELAYTQWLKTPPDGSSCPDPAYKLDSDTVMPSRYSLLDADSVGVLMYMLECRPESKHCGDEIETETGTRESEERELRALVYFNYDIRGVVGVVEVMSRVLTSTTRSSIDDMDAVDTMKKGAASTSTTTPIATDYTLVVQAVAGLGILVHTSFTLESKGKTDLQKLAKLVRTALGEEIGLATEEIHGVEELRDIAPGYKPRKVAILENGAAAGAAFVKDFIIDQLRHNA